MIEFKNIYKNIKENNQAILSNISFKIDKGDIVILQGPSGSGKSTILNIAALVDNFDKGKLLFNGKEIDPNNDKLKTDIRKYDIGFIYQNHYLLSSFSVIENIAMPLFVNSINKKKSYKMAEEIIYELGLEGKENSNIYQLSGGQMQRVSFARAIIKKPKLLLCDEPTGNLDRENSNNLFDYIIRMSKKFGMTSIIATHDQFLASKINNHINIIDGKIK